MGVEGVCGWWMVVLVMVVVAVVVVVVEVGGWVVVVVVVDNHHHTATTTTSSTTNKTTATNHTTTAQTCCSPWREFHFLTDVHAARRILSMFQVLCWQFSGWKMANSEGRLLEGEANKGTPAFQECVFANSSILVLIFYGKDRPHQLVRFENVKMLCRGGSMLEFRGRG